MQAHPQTAPTLSRLIIGECHRLQSSSFVPSTFCIQHRQFGDSHPSPPPSEAGLVVDARRVWDYLVGEVGVAPGRIAILGQSLGTGVATALAAQLADEDVASPKALVLLAPFTSLDDVLCELYIFFSVSRTVFYWELVCFLSRNGSEGNN